MDRSMSPEQTQRLVDKEIWELNAKYLASLSQLKARRNTFSAISKLPDDVLLEIFMIVKDSPSFSFEDFHGISQICQRWRYVVLDAPDFWTRLSTSRHGYTLLMLNRSKSAPPDVHLPRSTSTDTILAVLAHLERIRTLSLVPSYVSLYDIHESLSRRNGEAFLLEVLSIVCSSSITLGDSDLALSLANFGLTSRLRTLKLSQFPFGCVFPPLPNLTHLSLDEIEATHNPTRIQLTHILRQMPKLEVLLIGFDNLHLHDYTMTTPPEPIQLSHLTSLDIKSPANRDHVQWFLMQMFLPSLRRLDIDAEDKEQRDHIHMLQTIGSTIAHGDFGILDTLRISCDHFKIFNQQKPSSGDGLYVRVSFAVGDRIGGASTFDVAECIIISCTRPRATGIPSSPIQHLHIGWLNLEKDELHRLLENLPNVKTIDAQVDVAIPSIEALTIPFAKDHDSDHMLPNSTARTLDGILGILPKLEVIALSTDLEDLPRTALDEFFAYLVHRYKSSNAIKVLKLKETHKYKFSESEVELLNEVVVHVEISGRGI